MTTPERVARSYIAASNRNDQQAMVDLFHDDAEWIPISPIEPRRGKPAIAERYLNEVKAMNAPIIEDVYVADSQRCVVEFVVAHPERGHVPIVDVFDVDHEGRITRLAVYRR
ncbi:nuclear transport factor 2 family protein [Paraconexibacter antarcticus]|uniref:Nuclear transport factor 2 family protein n=1 Tax=Paraconexibacter antarcticus TaxID=2949664 RepID=A0ABY5DUZ5_9ACTN|nr:nuclear transport factor 2 family protein [Paraconexibacter antarcticus]UTI64861.1 nuclear transport factor 2 family protein [Paraconexibacter antarcticus]